MQQEKTISNLKPVAMSAPKVYHNWCNFYVITGLLVCLCISLGSVYYNVVLHGMLKEMMTRQLDLENRVGDCKCGNMEKTNKESDIFSMSSNHDSVQDITNKVKYSAGVKKQERMPSTFYEQTAIHNRDKRSVHARKRARNHRASLRKDVKGVSYVLESKQDTQIGEDGSFVNWNAVNLLTRNTLHMYSYANGKIRVREDGIYFIYAQVTFSTSFPTVSYSVYKFKNSIADKECITKCTTSVPNDQDVDLMNRYFVHCYTGKAAKLTNGEQIFIQDDYAADGFERAEIRMFVLQPESTYWGIIRLN